MFNTCDIKHSSHNQFMYIYIYIYIWPYIYDKYICYCILYFLYIIYDINGPNVSRLLGLDWL